MLCSNQIWSARYHQGEKVSNDEIIESLKQVFPLGSGLNRTARNSQKMIQTVSEYGFARLDPRRTSLNRNECNICIESKQKSTVRRSGSTNQNRSRKYSFRKLELFSCLLNFVLHYFSADERKETLCKMILASETKEVK